MGIITIPERISVSMEEAWCIIAWARIDGAA